MEVLLTICFIIVTLISVLYLKAVQNHNFWKKKKVPYAKPLPLFGNYAEYIFLKKPPGQIAEELCRRFPDAPYIGTFYGTDPALLVKDPETLKTIFTKDFYYFSGRENSEYNHSEVMTQGLFFMYGDEWKVVRQNLTPIFSSRKMKNMYYLIQDCTKSLLDMMDYETSVSQVLEAKNLMARYTMDCVSSCAFGVDANTMGRSENNPFRMMVEELFKPKTWDGLKVIFRLMWPGIFYSLGFTWFPKVMSDFFDQMLKNVFKARGNKPSSRNDFVDSILSFKQSSHIVGTNGQEEVRMQVNDELLVSQCMLFFTAGFETSSSALSFTLYELSKNQQVQARVLKEVDEYFQKNENVGYNCVTDLPYLDACVTESTRMYPVLGILPREVVEDYTFSTGLRVEKGMRIHIPMSYLHSNPEFFPEPEKYKPERFLPGATDEIKKYTFIPFGEGPRMCIGMRFSKMQVLAGLATLLKNYRVELAEGVPRKLEFDPKVFPIQSKCGLNLKFIKRE